MSGGFVMNRAIGCGLGALSLLLPLTAVCWSEPAAGADCPSVFETLTSVFSGVESLQRQGEQLDADLVRARQRMQRKAEIAAQLAIGRLSLSEAESLFRQLHAENPWVVAALRQRHPHCGPDEVHALGAIEAALNVVPDSERSSVAVRLRAELEARRARP